MTLIFLILHMLFRSGTSDGHTIFTWYLFLSCSSCCVSLAIWSSWLSISGCFSQFKSLRQPPASSSTSSTCFWCRGTLTNRFSQDRLDSKNQMCKKNGSSLCFFLFTFPISHRVDFKCFWWLWPCSLCLCYYWANLSTSTGNTRAETAWACTGWGFSFCACSLALTWSLLAHLLSFSLCRGISVYDVAVRRSSLSCKLMIWRKAAAWTATPPALTANQRRWDIQSQFSTLFFMKNNFSYEPNILPSSTAGFCRSVPQSVHPHYRVLSGLHL